MSASGTLMAARTWTCTMNGHEWTQMWAVRAPLQVSKKFGCAQRSERRSKVSRSKAADWRPPTTRCATDRLEGSAAAAVDHDEVGPELQLVEQVAGLDPTDLDVLEHIRRRRGALNHLGHDVVGGLALFRHGSCTGRAAMTMRVWTDDDVASGSVRHDQPGRAAHRSQSTSHQ